MHCGGNIKWNLNFQWVESTVGVEIMCNFNLQMWGNKKNRKIKPFRLQLKKKKKKSILKDPLLGCYNLFTSFFFLLFCFFKRPRRGLIDRMFTRHGPISTWMTLMLRPVSRESCSRMCLVGFGVAANAAFSVSSCLALMVVRGPRRFPTALCSSVSLLPGSLSDRWPVSESFPSSCGSWESGDRLGSLHVVTARGERVAHFIAQYRKWCHSCELC